MREHNPPPPLTTTLTGIITSTYLPKGSKFATPSYLYVDDNKNMNLSCWGIKIRHPLWLLRWQGSLHQLIFMKGSNLPPFWLTVYVDDPPAPWLIRWQGSLHQLIFQRDQNLAPPLTYMWCNIWYMCYVLLYTSATSDSDAEQRRGCSEHVITASLWWHCRW